ncbi:cytochrome P450 [Trametes maxima]|nr:cytochrome P450 [Trametes maxima]
MLRCPGNVVPGSWHHAYEAAPVVPGPHNKYFILLWEKRLPPFPLSAQWHCWPPPLLMAAVSVLLAPMACSAVAGGIASAILHRRPVEGHRALFLLPAVFGVSYCAAVAFRTLSSFALSAGIVLYCIFLLALAVSTVAYRLSPWHPLASYPGPRLAKATGLWLTYVSIGGRRYLVIDELHARYGPFVRIGPNILSINSPSATSLYLNAEKSDTYRRRLRGRGVELFLRPDVPKLHRERKRIWARLFTAASLNQLMPFLERRTSELMRCIEKHQAVRPNDFVDLREAFAHWGFDFTADVVFGGSDDFELMKNGDPRGLTKTGKIAFAVTDVLGPSTWIMDILWNLPQTSRANALVSSISNALDRVLKDTPKWHGLLSHLVSEGVPEDDMLRDAFIAMQGGSDNISVMLTLSVYFLLCEPIYHSRLRQELDEAFPDPTAPLPAEELAALPFLNGTINEALRLGTPFFLPRVSPPGGLVMDGQYIPAGVVVALAAYSQQISPENFFPEPTAFHPDRWIAGGLGPNTKTEKGVLASFTFGPYACVGKPLAYREMRHALARLVLMFDMALPHDFDARAFRDGVLNMHTTFFKHPLLVRVARRRRLLDSAVDLASDECLVDTAS